MPDPKPYAIRDSGRTETPAPEVPLEERITLQAKRITGIERAIARNEAKAREYEEDYARLMAEMVSGYKEAAARLKGLLANAEFGMLELIKMLPEKKRRYRHGRTTFGITPARKSVEILDGEEAVTEIEACGEKVSDECIAIKKSPKKKELLAFIERGDAPGFEHIRVVHGEDSLRRTKS